MHTVLVNMKHLSLFIDPFCNVGLVLITFHQQHFNFW